MGDVVRGLPNQPPAYLDPAADSWEDGLQDHITAETPKLVKRLLDSDKWMAVLADNDKEVQWSVVSAMRQATDGYRATAGHTIAICVNEAANDHAAKFIKAECEVAERLIPAEDFTDADLLRCI